MQAAPGRFRAYPGPEKRERGYREKVRVFIPIYTPTEATI